MNSLQFVEHCTYRPPANLFNMSLAVRKMYAYNHADPVSELTCTGSMEGLWIYLYNSLKSSELSVSFLIGLFFATFLTSFSVTLVSCVVFLIPGHRDEPLALPQLVPVDRRPGCKLATWCLWPLYKTLQVLLEIMLNVSNISIIHSFLFPLLPLS